MRAIYTARPTYATRRDPLYGVTPLLHEPDPKHISWWQSATGWNDCSLHPVYMSQYVRVR